MARRASSDIRGVSEWVRSFGEQLGTELGRVIAGSLQRTLASHVNLGDIAKRLGGGGGRRGRRAAGEKSTCSEPGCNNPVLAKGLCRSHYYRARYRSQQAATPKPNRRKKARRKGRSNAGRKRSAGSAAKTSAASGSSAVKAE